MSQRMAFLFSIALTIVIAIGVVIARDRLFPVNDAEGNVAATSTPTTATAKSFQAETTMKIVDVFEPTPTPASATGSNVDWNGDSSDDHDGHDDDHDHHGDHEDDDD